MSFSIGIMQGRLTPTKGRGIQFFPFSEWEIEFDLGKKIGISEIEWIFDAPDYEENPLWNNDGCKKIIEKISNYGIVINSVCWDYFMRKPFYKVQECEKLLLDNKKVFQQVVDNMKLIGANLIEIPMVDDSSIQSERERNKAIEFVRWASEYASQMQIDVGLETDLPPDSFYLFLNEIGCKNVYANYDSGNSSGLGYDHSVEIHNLGNYVRNVHIKDRVLGNGTVTLGEGSADFDKVFSSLKDIKYCKSIILQAARSEDGTESNNILSQIEFVNHYLEKYGMD